MLLALLASCISPAALGAVPDDHKDDTPAFQRAIDQAIAEHAEVCIPPGVWNLARPPGRVGSLELTGGPIAIRGAGPGTVLRMTGPGNHRTWAVLYAHDAHDVVIRDLTIDGLDAVETREQTHLIQLSPGTHDVVIAGVTLGPMRRPGQAIGDGIGGDCLRLLGEVGREVADVTVADTRFVDCDRSGIGLQRALRDVALVGVTITGTGDTPIDFEPTGQGAITDVAIVDVAIHQPPAAQSAWAITLTGIGDDLASRLLVERATLDGGGIAMLNVADVEIADSAITAHPATGGRAMISVMRRGTDVRLLRNTITRPAAAGPGLVIRTSHNNGFFPHGLTVLDNTLTQATGQPVIVTNSAGGLVVRHNVIDYTGDPGVPMVQAIAELGDVAGLAIEDNDVRGASGALIATSARGAHQVSEVSQRGNRGDADRALRCDPPGGSVTSVTADQRLTDARRCGGASDALPAPGSPPAPVSGAARGTERD